MSNDIRDILGRLSQITESEKPRQLPALFRPRDISTVLTAKKDPEHPTKGYFVGGESNDEDRAKATEDIVSSMKKRLGDYLQDVASAVKNDSDLTDKSTQSGDKISSAVKTVQTDDGHEIKIHGNEDDGFRVSIRDRDLTTRFHNLDEAVMACEMYCNKRRRSMQSLDYVEEA
jgi:hypothetical protein